MSSRGSRRRVAERPHEVEVVVDEVVYGRMSMLPTCHGANLAAQQSLVARTSCGSVAHGLDPVGLDEPQLLWW